MRPLALLLVAGSLASGCFFKRPDGERLVTEVRAQADRITALETQLGELSTREGEHHAALQASLAEMRTQLDDVRAQLEATGRGSADFGADLAMVRDLAQRLDGRLAEIDQGIAATQAQLREQDQQLDQQIRLLAQRAGIDVTLRESDIPADRPAHFAAAQAAYQAADHVRARALLGEYIRRYPNDENTDDAHFLVGRSYQDQQQWQRAIGAYREVIRTQSSNVLDQALFNMASAFYELHDCVNARNAYQALKDTRPQSPLVRDAERRIRELRNPPRGYCAG